MKTKEERREAFREAIQTLVSACMQVQRTQFGRVTEEVDTVYALFDAELEAAEEVRVLDRIEQKAYTANQVLFNTDCGEDTADVRKAAADVLEEYLKDGEET